MPQKPNPPRPIDRRNNRPHGAQRYLQTTPVTRTPKTSRSRAEFFSWAAQNGGGTWVTITSKTSPLAITSAVPPIPIPPDAYGVILFATVNANTATSGIVHLNFYNDSAGAGSIGSMACQMVSANFSERQQMIVPLVNGQVYYDIDATGTVAYTATIFFCGYLRR